MPLLFFAFFRVFWLLVFVFRLLLLKAAELRVWPKDKDKQPSRGNTRRATYVP